VAEHDQLDDMQCISAVSIPLLNIWLTSCDYM